LKIGIVGPEGYKNPDILSIIGKVVTKVMKAHNLTEEHIQLQVIGADNVSSSVLDFITDRSFQYYSTGRWLRKDALPTMAGRIDYALIFSPSSEECLEMFVEECKKFKVKRKVIL